MLADGASSVYAFVLRRRMALSPAKAPPKRMSVEGSGTALAALEGIARKPWKVTPS